MSEFPKLYIITGMYGRTSVIANMTSIFEDAGIAFEVMKINNNCMIIESELKRIYYNGINHVFIDISLDDLAINKVFPSFILIINNSHSSPYFNNGLLEKVIQRWVRYSSFIIVNKDDSNLRDINYIDYKNLFTFGIYNKTDIDISDIEFTYTNTRFKFKLRGTEKLVKIHLIGLVNLYNALPSIIGCFCAKIPFDHILKGLNKREGNQNFYLYFLFRERNCILLNYYACRLKMEYFYTIFKEITKGTIFVVFIENQKFEEEILNSVWLSTKKNDLIIFMW